MLELQDDGTIVLATKDDSEKKQKWTRTIVDQILELFVWSNIAGDTNKFLATLDDSTLVMKGNDIV